MPLAPAKTTDPAVYEVTFVPPFATGSAFELYANASVPEVVIGEPVMLKKLLLFLPIYCIV